jgi:integrative and conjugative element protein (TIGR02256 family)
MQHVYVAYADAYQRIFEEARISPGRETGGILVGRVFHLHGQSVLVIVAASGPGISADRRGYTYAPDVDQRQVELDVWREVYAAYDVDYVGEWHKHPPGIHQLSAGDRQQIIAILTDDSYYLPDGVCTPLVTIEDGAFLFHVYYSPRETMSPEGLAYTVIQGDVCELLDQLVVLEHSSGEAYSTSSETPHHRWGVTEESVAAARRKLGLHIPIGEKVTPEQFGPNTVIIDMNAYIPPPGHPTRPGTQSQLPAEESMAPPPFPSPPPLDELPPGPPLRGWSERELADLEHYCATRNAQVTRQQHGDGKFWFMITFAEPVYVNPRYTTTPQYYHTPEGTVEILSSRSEQPVSIDHIILDAENDFPKRPPTVTVAMSNEQTIGLKPEALFPMGWRSHLRMRDVLKAALDVLQKTGHEQHISTLIEYHGRLIIREIEHFSRSVADICADFNRSYSFEKHGQSHVSDQTDQRK